MSTLRKTGFAEGLPDAVDSRNAAALLRILEAQSQATGRVDLDLASIDGNHKTITLTPKMVEALLEFLGLLSSGQGFTLVPLDVDLTTQEAADHLNVSRPYLIKLLEEEKIPYVTVGRHRRIRAADLFAYKAARDATRKKALEELAALDADLL